MKHAIAFLSFVALLLPTKLLATWDTLIVANVGFVRAIVEDSDQHVCILGYDLRWWDSDAGYWRLSDAPPIPSSQYPQYLYVSPDQSIWVTGYQSLLYRSTDNGKSFHTVPIPVRGRVYVSPVGELFLWAPRMYRSTDQGQSWDSLGIDIGGSSPVFDGSGNLLLPFGSRTLRLYRGATSVDTLPSMTFPKDLTAACGSGIAYLEPSTSSLTLHVSFDAGSTWQARSVPYETATQLIGKQSGGLYILANRNLLASTDTGANWTRSEAPGGLIAPANRKPIWVSDSRRIWHFNNGAWAESDTGLCVNYLVDLECKADTILTNSEYVGSIRSTDAGRSFSLLLDSTYFGSIVQSPRGVLFSSQRQSSSHYTITRSTNGLEWVGVKDDDRDGYLTMDSSGTLYRHTNHQVQWSIDDGDSWSQEIDLPVSGWKAAFYDDLFISFDNTRVFVSRDHGNSWTEAAFPPHESLTPSVAVKIPHTCVCRIKDVFHIATDSSFFSSSDWGQTWIPTTSGLHSAVGALAPDGKGHIYASEGTNSLAVFDQEMKEWKQVGPDVQIDVATLAFSSTGLLIGTYGGPLYRIPLDELTLSVEAGLKSTSISSLQTYPNPATSMIWISTDLPDCDLRMTDPLGRTVLTQRWSKESPVHVSTLADGIYRISTITNGVELSGPVVVSH